MKKKEYTMRGFWFTIEAILAGILLVSFLAFLATTSFTSPPEDFTSLAYKTLQSLDDQDLLRANAAILNHTAINNQINLPTVNHAVQICSLNTCVGEIPSASNIWVASFLTPGIGKYDPREIKLYLYR